MDSLKRSICGILLALSSCVSTTTQYEKVQDQMLMIYTMEDDFIIRSCIQDKRAALADLDLEWDPVFDAWRSFMDAYDSGDEKKAAKAWCEFTAAVDASEVPSAPAISEVEIECD